MKRTQFLIPSLLAAGFTAQDGAQAVTPQLSSGGNGDPDRQSLFEVFKQGHAVTLAQHRSHSSHSSHSSHRSGGGGHYSHTSHTSHRSSTGGGSSYSSPVYTAPEPASPPPPHPPTRAPSSGPNYIPLRSAQPGEATAPRTEALPALSGRTERFKAIVRRVQIGLLAQGYYAGAIDGIVGPAMRGGIRKFQTVRGLAVTGTITPELLDALRISSE